MTIEIDKSAQIDSGVKIGANVVIYPGVIIKEGVIIEAGAVLGRVPRSTSTMNRQVESKFGHLVIGPGTIIGANSVIYTNNIIGENVHIGDLTKIREDCTIGDNVVIGGSVNVMYNVLIGMRSRVIDGSTVTGNAQIGHDVYIGPNVTMTNDDNVYRSRFGIVKSNPVGPVIHDGALIGTGANIISKIDIGEGAIVAQGAVVRTNVLPFTVVSGNPARYIKDIDSDTVRIVRELLASESR